MTLARDPLVSAVTGHAAGHPAASAVVALRLGELREVLERVRTGVRPAPRGTPGRVAEDLAERAGLKVTGPEAELREETADALLHTLGRDRLEQARAEGRSASPDGAVEWALVALR